MDYFIPKNEISFSFFLFLLSVSLCKTSILAFFELIVNQTKNTKLEEGQIVLKVQFWPRIQINGSFYTIRSNKECSSNSTYYLKKLYSHHQNIIVIQKNNIFEIYRYSKKILQHMSYIALQIQLVVRQFIRILLQLAIISVI